MMVLYEVLLHLVFILGLPVFLVMGLLRGKYLVNLRERLGNYQTPAKSHDLWIHAVSVGEAIAARPVVDWIERLRPGTTMVFTTTTITGQAQARRLYPQATVAYFPFDFSVSVRRCLTHHRPRVFATMETEIWPNVTRIARAEGLRLLLANGRISDRSFPRYRMFRPLVARVLQTYDRILAREELDRERFVEIGAPAGIVETTGNVKFDFEPDLAPLPGAALLEKLIAGRPVVVLGSTLEGEDELLLPAIRTLSAESGIFFIVAPRKPERFDVAARLYAAAVPRVVRRSTLAEGDAADLLILDTFGELARVYRYASAAFIGGSLVPLGGHNPIEAAAAGIPVCFGPSMTNFREIASVFLRDRAAVEVRSAGEFRDFVLRMTGDESERKAWGERATASVLRNRGASERTARRIVELLT